MAENVANERESISPSLANELIAVLWDVRDSLVHHAAQLPLKRRDHGPALARIDAANDRIMKALR